VAAALGQRLDAVIGIDHIGSTAVPGLAGKDVIDVQATAAGLAHADRLAPPVPAGRLHGDPLPAGLSAAR
jgi:dephospho-CoA kinase